MTCDIIIPVWNQVDLTKKCIDNIFKNTNYAFHLIIIDNGSDRETKEYLDNLLQDKKDTVSLLRNKDNLGFIKATNQGIQSSSAPYICLLNNDTRVTAGWLSEMVKIAENRPDIGIVNPNSNTLGRKPKRHQTLEALAKELSAYSGQWSELAWATGFCMLIKRKVIQETGVFDEIYGMGTFEDADFCKRAKGLGYISVCAKASYVYHHERRSFIKFRKFDHDFRRNQKIFHNKWGKTKRIIYVVSENNQNYITKINNEVLDLARRGHIVWVFLKNQDRRKIVKHSNIYTYSLSERFFYIVTLLRILKRKKKFDRILTDNENYAKTLNIFKNIHKAEVIHGQ